MQLATSSLLTSAAASAPLVAAILPVIGAESCTWVLLLDQSLAGSQWDGPNVIYLPISQHSWDSYVATIAKSGMVGALID